MKRIRTSPICRCLGLVLGSVLISACADSRIIASSTDGVDAGVMSKDKDIISMAAKALERSDSRQVGALLVKVSEWGKSERALLISGLEDPDPNVRYFCSMAFYVYASDLTYADGLKAYDSVKNDVQAKTALQISTYWAIGWAKGSPPESALAIEGKLKSIAEQSKAEGLDHRIPEQTSTQPQDTYDTAPASTGSPPPPSK